LFIVLLLCIFIFCFSLCVCVVSFFFSLLIINMFYFVLYEGEKNIHTYIFMVFVFLCCLKRNFEVASNSFDKNVGFRKLRQII
jgi:hypothetical protein